MLKELKYALHYLFVNFTIIKLQQERLSKLTILDDPFLVGRLGFIIAFPCTIQIF